MLTPTVAGMASNSREENITPFCRRRHISAIYLRRVGHVYQGWVCLLTMAVANILLIILSNIFISLLHSATSHYSYLMSLSAIISVASSPSLRTWQKNTHTGGPLFSTWYAGTYTRTERGAQALSCYFPVSASATAEHLLQQTAHQLRLALLSLALCAAFHCLCLTSGCSCSTHLTATCIYLGRVI